MPCFSHSEGSAIEGDDFEELKFFKEGNVTEHWSPSFTKISLELDEAAIDLVVDMMVAAETVAGAFGSFVTITTQHPVAWQLQIEADDSGEGFRSDYTELEILVARGSAGGSRTRWMATNKHTDDKIHTEWLDRRDLAQMKLGVVPSA